MIRVLTVDDHPLLREGIAVLIDTQSDLQLIGEASNGREALEQFRNHRPDITLMDLQMPEVSGIDAISAIRGEFPEARIIVLTTHAGDFLVSRALKAGARAYLLKGSLRNELLETIRAVPTGQMRVSSEVAAEIAEHFTDHALTPREVDVLRLVTKGNANKEIAAQLSLTEDTVKSHIRNILGSLKLTIGPTRSRLASIAESSICSWQDIPRTRDDEEAVRGCRIPARGQYDWVSRGNLLNRSP